MNLLSLSPYVFGTNLTWYSVFVLMGALVTYVISDYFYKKDPESKKCPDLILNTFLVAFPSGLLGARIWYILSELEYYLADPISMLKVWEGGLAIQGGVIFGALVGIVFARHLMRKNGMTLKITTLMDMVIPNILIAQVIGRWGNFFNREVYGACVDKMYALKNWWILPDWLVEYMRGGIVGGEYIACSGNGYAQPLFLYEGILNFIGFIIITFVLRKFFTKRIDGSLSAFYLIWYGTVRACLEPLRNEMFIMRWGKMSQSIITSILYIILGAGLLIALYIKECKNKQLVLEVKKEIEVKEEITPLEETLVVSEVESVNVENEIKEEALVKPTAKKATTTKKTTNKKVEKTKLTTSKKTVAKKETNKTQKPETATKKVATKQSSVKTAGENAEKTKVATSKKTTTKKAADKTENTKATVKKTTAKSTSTTRKKTVKEEK